MTTPPTPKQQVLAVYPRAKLKKCYSGDIVTEYVIWSKGNVLGYGGTSRSAWLDASKKLKGK